MFCRNMDSINGILYLNDDFNVKSALVAATIVASLVLALQRFAFAATPGGKAPPHIPHTIPYLGHAVSFGTSPIEFLVAAHQKYGPVFSFTMVGKTFTYLTGSDSSAPFFNSKNEDLNAEDVYAKLVTPVFGKGVAYDVPSNIFLEQKKMLKTGLNIARFKTHVPLIEQETRDYFERWGQSGEKDLFRALSELIILTASSCLHGEEIRSIMSERVASLYWDLDGGFSHEAWLLPSWLPLPSFRKRDEAHLKIKQLFYEAIDKRRQADDKPDDMLQTLIDSSYKSGRGLTDDEIAGMMIGLLMAGQHTSSTTSAWLGFYLAKHKDVQEQLYKEAQEATSSCGITYDTLKDCLGLERCIKETLRLRPPIMTMMRMCRTPLKVGDHIIPPGHQVCVSPTTNQSLPHVWEQWDQFSPDRFLAKGGAVSEDKFSYIPFGAGRHRCIGESFAYVQIKTIWTTLLDMFEFELADSGFPPINYQTMIHTPSKPIIRYRRRKQAL